MRRVNVHLTKGEESALELLSEVTGERKATLIRRAIDEYVKRKRWEGVTGLQDLQEVFA